MPLPAPPARRAVLLTAAALVALGTLAYAFAARDAPTESREAPLAADGDRVADVDLRAEDCLSLDVRAVEAVATALRVGCEDAANDIGAGDGASGSGGAPPIPRPAPTPAPAPDTPSAPVPPADGVPSSPAPTPPSPRPTTSPTARPTPPPPTLADPAADDGRPTSGAGGGGSQWGWWNVPDPEPASWPDSLYDALAPLLSPPRPAPPPPSGAPHDPPYAPPPARCTNVCDPRELGGTGSPWVTAGDDDAPTRVGLLARALDALDAYVRLRA